MNIKNVKRLAYVIFCLALIFLGDRLIAESLRVILLSSQIRFSKVYQGGQKNDILILGDSRAVHALHAPSLQKTLNASVLHLGYNGMSMELAEAILNDYLEKNFKPKAIIIEITSLSEESNLVKELKLYRKFSPRVNQLLEAISPNLIFAGSISWLFDFNGEVFLRALYFLRKSDQDWIAQHKISAQFLESIPKMSDDQIALLPKNAISFCRILQLAKERKIAVGLFIAPYLPVYVKKIRNLTNWIDRVHNLAPDIRIWNYAYAIDNPDYFADRIHLNKFGSAALLGFLVHDGFFGIYRPVEIH